MATWQHHGVMQYLFAEVACSACIFLVHPTNVQLALIQDMCRLMQHLHSPGPEELLGDVRRAWPHIVLLQVKIISPLHVRLQSWFKNLI